MKVGRPQAPCAPPPAVYARYCLLRLYLDKVRPGADEQARSASHPVKSCHLGPPELHKLCVKTRQLGTLDSEVHYDDETFTTPPRTYTQAAGSARARRSAGRNLARDRGQPGRRDPRQPASPNDRSSMTAFLPRTAGRWRSSGSFAKLGPPCRLPTWRRSWRAPSRTCCDGPARPAVQRRRRDLLTPRPRHPRPGPARP